VQRYTLRRLMGGETGSRKYYPKKYEDIPPSSRGPKIGKKDQRARWQESVEIEKAGRTGLGGGKEGQAWRGEHRKAISGRFATSTNSVAGEGEPSQSLGRERRRTWMQSRPNT